jgi:hypothetical protein
VTGRRGLLALAGLAPLGSARAQGWVPERPVRLVVPFAPGGSQDVLGRLLAQAVSGPLGQQVVVENRAGAGGVLGAETVARAAPDGTTLFLETAGQTTIAKAIGRRLTYDPIEDFTPILWLTDSPVALLAAPALPVGDARGLLRYAREAQDPLPYASTGIGTNTHLIMEDLKAREGLRVEHVPYRGAAAAFNDLQAGRIALMFVSVPSVLAVAPGPARGADPNRGGGGSFRGQHLDRALGAGASAGAGAGAAGGGLRRGAALGAGDLAARGAGGAAERGGWRRLRGDAAAGPGAVDAGGGAAGHHPRLRIRASTAARSGVSPSWARRAPAAEAKRMASGSGIPSAMASA